MTFSNDIITISAIHFIIIQVYSSKIVLMQPAKLTFERHLQQTEVSCHNKTVVCELKFSHKESGDKIRNTFGVSDIDTTLCTHILYKFVEVNSQSLAVELNETDLTKKTHMLQLATLGKKAGSSLKLLLSVGGGGNDTWSLGPSSFAKIGKSSKKRRAFLGSVFAMLKEFKFHGIDVEWNRLDVWSEISIVDGHKYLGILMQELNKILKPEYLLTISVSAHPRSVLPPKVLNHLSQLVDQFHIGTHDIRTHQFGESYHHSALLKDEDGYQGWISVQSAVWYFKTHIGGAKLVMRIATHGKIFRLAANKYQHGLGDKTEGTELKVGYREICRNLTTQVGWTTYFDGNCRVPFARRGSQWVSFDDLNSTEEKVDYAVQEGLKGVMVTSIGNDDFDGEACQGGSRDLKQYPLLKTINHRIVTILGLKCEVAQASEPLELLLGLGAMSLFFCMIAVIIVIRKYYRYGKRKVSSGSSVVIQVPNAPQK